jgi:hypothetical protein
MPATLMADTGDRALHGPVSVFPIRPDLSVLAIVIGSRAGAAYSLGLSRTGSQRVYGKVVGQA